MLAELTELNSHDIDQIAKPDEIQKIDYNTNKLICICVEIKNELANKFCALKDVEIFEVTNYKSKNKYAGFCDIQQKKQKIYLQLKNHDTLKCLEPSQVIITLLHEFAHCISPNLKDPHGNEFYQTFENIVAEAKSSGIYCITYNGDFKKN